MLLLLGFVGVSALRSDTHFHRAAQRAFGIAALSLVLFALLPGVGRAAEAGEVTLPFSVGTNVITHHFSSGSNTTLENSFKFSEFPGIGCYLTDQIRLGLNFQFTELVTPVPGNNLNAFGILPQINYSFWGPLTVSLVPSFYPVYDGVSEFAFALQGVLTYAHTLGDGFSATASLEVPVFFKPSETLGLTPIVGIVYRVP